MAQQFECRLASGPDDIQAAQRLRYDVFVRELGADGPLIDHDAKLEKDELDPFFDHLLLLDHARETDAVIGVYRLLPLHAMSRVGRFYSDSEYDLSALLSSGRNLLELGRSCVHADYRGGTALFHLWNGLADYVLAHDIDVLFGTASFHGTDIASLAQPLSYLHQNHLAPADLRVRSHDAHYQKMDLLPADAIDRKAAMLNTPALIKAYLRLGGFVGDGAYVDHAFNTTDVCLVMDTAQMNAKHRKFYEKRERS